MTSSPRPGSHSSPITFTLRRNHRHSTFSAVLRRNNNTPFITSPVNFPHGLPKSHLSSRKLAAFLWHLHFMDPSSISGDGSELELAHENSRIDPPSHRKPRDELEKKKDPTSRPDTILHSRNGIQRECCKEEAKKWDTTGFHEGSNESNQIHGRKHNEKRNLGGDSIVSALLAELVQAQRCINNLKAARKSTKKKAQQLVQKFEKEMMFWKKKELRKFRSKLDEVKDKLGGERRSLERMELMNAKLLHKLAEADRCAKQFKKKYEEEKRGRELMEEVCNELANQIGGDKSRLEELEMESIKIINEVEEERKMMQISDLLREERVQMKLNDARLMLEEKYDQMIQFFAFLQHSLRSEAAADELAKNQSIVDLSNDFLNLDDIFSIYEEIKNDKNHEKVIKRYEDVGMDNRSNSSCDFNNSGLQVVKVVNHKEDNNTYMESSEREVNEVSKRKASSSSKLRPCITNRTRTSAIIAGVLCSLEGEEDNFCMNWESEGMNNPHIVRAMKGCIEWPRGGVTKSNLKANVSLDARVRNQRSQLQHILKSKA